MRGASNLIVAIVVALAVLGVGCGSSDSDSEEGVAGPSEVALEEVSDPGDNPFTDPVGEDEDDVEPPKAVAQSGKYSGDLPGLYGGTMDYATCDRKQLVTYLQSEPDKAKAWSETMEIEPPEIKSYVNRLTPVTLRTDTRVTNHGYVDGAATPIPSLLQAGTAVLVDRYGTPTVKCYCGNPLTAAVPIQKPTYIGTPWSGFQPGNVTIIQQSTTIINVYKLYDLETGKIFSRPAGSVGNLDLPPDAPDTPTTPPDAPPDSPPEEAQEQPSASFEPQAGSVGDTYTLHVEGFAPNVTLDIQLTRPDGVSESYSITTGDAGTGQYTFPQTGGDTPLGTYSATITNPDTGASATASTTVS